MKKDERARINELMEELFCIVSESDEFKDVKDSILTSLSDIVDILGLVPVR